MSENIISPEQEYIAELSKRVRTPFPFQQVLLLLGFLVSLLTFPYASAIVDHPASSISYLAAFAVALSSVLIPSMLLIFGARSKSRSSLILQAGGLTCLAFVTAVLISPNWISFSEVWSAVAGNGFGIAATGVFSMAAIVVSVLAGGDEKIRLADELAHEYSARGITLKM